MVAVSELTRIGAKHSTRNATLLFGAVLVGVAGVAFAGRPPRPVAPAPAMELAAPGPTRSPAGNPFRGRTFDLPAGLFQATPTHRLINDDARFWLPGFITPAPTATPAPPRHVFKLIGRSWPGPGSKVTR